MKLVSYLTILLRGAYMFDVVAMGELLIDFTQNGVSQQGNGLFEANPGGAPCNVLAMLSKLGRKTAFIGKVGDDIFGKTLRETIRKINIDDKGLVTDKNVNTTLAFVKTDENGDRSFSFYRNPGADMMLMPEEVDVSLLENTRIFHFGTLSMTHKDVREATCKAISIAKSHNALISFDPNLRPALWSNIDDARNAMDYGASQCDIMKIEEGEVRFLTQNENLCEAIEQIRNKYSNIKLLLVTYGKDGAEAYCGKAYAKAPSYLEVKTIDTTGAGDTFCGSCLSFVLDNLLDTFDDNKLLQMLRYANAAASLVTTKKGAINSMPEVEDIKKLVNSNL